MQPIYKSCYPLDKQCYSEYNLTEDILMENASLGMAKYIREHFKPQSSILIVSGVGNNGADGIVLARLLQDSYNIKLYTPFGVKSAMAELQFKRVKLLGVEIIDRVVEADIVVDAIFGAGLSRELNKKTQNIVKELNLLNGFKIACDVPTGLDNRGNPLPLAFIANTTITMGALKESLYLDVAKDYVGEIICVDLGVSHKRYTNGFDTDLYLLEESDIKLPIREKRATHKGDFGHLAIIVGEMKGASIMSGLSALRFGTGLVTMVGNIDTPIPLELMQKRELPLKTTAIACGMGFGENCKLNIIDDILNSKLPIILDADILKSEIVVEFLEQKDRVIVLTPHPKEFVNIWSSVMDSTITIDTLQANRFDMVREFSLKFPHITLLLKGANMIMAENKRLFVNPYGSSKLSKGGSGDVLSGLIGSLLAQKYPPLESAITASLALTKSAKAYSKNSYSMLPTDLINGLGSI